MNDSVAHTKLWHALMACLRHAVACTGRKFSSFCACQRVRNQPTFADWRHVHGFKPTMTNDTSDNAEAKPLTLWKLIFLAYFWVSGGMYGSEPLMQMAPPAYVFLCLLVVPVIYCVPISLIGADLAIAYPLDGGFVAWIDMALGTRIGAHNMYWTWANYALDAAAYPLLAGNYITKATGLSTDFVELFAGSIVLLIAIIRLFDFNVLINFSTVLTVISLIPACFYVAFAARDIDPSTWLNTDGHFPCSSNNGTTNSTASVGEYQLSRFADRPLELPLGTCVQPLLWGNLLPYVFWINGGFFSISALAGQVRNPRRDVPLALLVLIPLVLAETLLPLGLSLSIDQDLDNYAPGHYAQLGRQVAGLWLDGLITFAAITSLIGTCNAGVLVCDEALQSFFLRHSASFFEAQAVSPARWRRWFFNTKNRIAPAFAAIDCAFLALCIWVPFKEIISADMMLMNFDVMLCFVAYVKLKWQHPDANWLYGRSWISAAVLSFMPILATFGMSYFALGYAPTVYGIPYWNLFVCAIVIVLGLIIDAIVTLWKRRARFGQVDALEDAALGEEKEPLLHSVQ